MTVQIERRIAAAKWVILARWFYPVGILLIGFLTKIIAGANTSFAYGTMVTLFFSYLFFNFIILLILKKVEKKYSAFFLNLVCYGMVFSDFVFMLLVIHFAGGVESVSHIFLFLPIVTSSFIFGGRGAVMTAVFAGILVNGLVVLEHYNFIPHINRYGIPTFEFTNLSIGLTKTVTASIFYVIIGFFSGYSANMLFKREASYEEKVKELDDKAEELKRREIDLASSNAELDEKIKELERFQKLAVGRELKMMELKEEISALQEKTGQAKP